MVNVQSPLIGLEYTPETGVYIATLERQLAECVLRESKFRALLELLTGEMWDDVALPYDNAGPELSRIAEDTLVARSGMNRADARVLVAKRWDQFNKSKSIEDVVVTQAVPVEQATTTDDSASKITVHNAKEMFEGWKQRRTEQGVLSSKP